MVDLPYNKEPVECKWVYTITYHVDGTINKYKARLVAKGYAQTYGIDYQETFAPVAKMNSVKVLISLVATQKWPLYQFDVKNALLHSDLEEEFFMKPPPGFQNIGAKGKVCKIQKALYGLKQSPRAWFERFRLVMVNNGYVSK